MSPARPIVFLAFADARSDLSSLKVEGWSLKDQFDELKRRGMIDDLVIEENASLERIYKVLQDYRDRIAIFHFGGHAEGDRLLLQSAFEPRPAYAEGLATLLGQQRGLKLVFLNGCSTRPQVKRLLDAGVPAVIATAWPIDDEVAAEFAVAFYQALTTGSEDEHRKINGGCSLALAFAQAVGLSRAARRGKTRDLVAGTPSHEDVMDDGGFPWNLQYRPGSEQVARWNLFEDDPLFGVPDLPATIEWPVEPYRNLEFFQRRHARIFFGRGRAIRELYDLLTLPAESAESRLIFYFGQTGVGKTSVLAAGLLPRVETLFETRYCRRSEQVGLLGTLREKLATGDEPCDLGTAWLAIEREARRPLVIVLDQAEECFSRPLPDLRPKEEVCSLFEAVIEAFAPTRPERPRGRLILSFRKEWLAEFDEIRKALHLDVKPKMLDPLDRAGVIEAIEGPAGHFGLIIDPDRNSVQPGEASLAEFMADGLFDTLANPHTEQESPIAPTLQILLNRMWKEANDPKRMRGRPTFNRGLYQELKGKGFKLNEVIQEQFARIAEVEGLGDAVEKGLLLDLLEFFTTREVTAGSHTRREVRDRYPHQAVEQLDALLEACQNRYLLAHVGVGADGTHSYRLTHDTLAPLLRERSRISPDLAQLARQILEGRAVNWKGRPTDPLLDRVDLTTVEEGLPWMRALEKSEMDLLEASRRTERERQSHESARENRLKQAETEARHQLEHRLAHEKTSNRVLRHRAYVLFALLGVMAGIAALARYEMQQSRIESGRANEESRKAKVQQKRAELQAEIATSRQLAASALTELDKRLDRALILGAEALRARPVDPPLEARRLLYRALHTRPEVVSFLHSDAVPIRAVAYSPDGKTLAAGYGMMNDASRPGGVELWDVTTRQRRGATLTVPEGGVWSLAFSPDGKTLAAGYQGYNASAHETHGGVVRWESSNWRRLPEKLDDQVKVTSLAFSPDGKTLALGYDTQSGDAEGTSAKGGVLLWAPAARQGPVRIPIKEGAVNRIEFNADGSFLAVEFKSTASDANGIMFYGVASGKRLTRNPYDEAGQNGACAAFTSDGNILAVGFDDSERTRGPLRLWNLRSGERKEFAFRNFRASISRMAFSPDGKTLALDTSSGMVLWDVEGGKLIKEEPLPLPEGERSGHAFSPDGKTLAVGYVGKEPEVLSGVVLWDLKEMLPPSPHVTLSLAQGHLSCMAFNPERQLLAAGVRDLHAKKDSGGVVLWDLKEEKRQFAVIPVEGGNVQSVTFNRGGKSLAAGHAGRGPESPGGVMLWELETPQGPGTAFPTIPGAVPCVAFSPDDTLLAAAVSGPEHNSVILWDVSDRRQVAEMPLPQPPLGVTIRCIAFSPDGKTLAAGFGDGEGQLSGGVVLFELQPKPQVGAILTTDKNTVLSLCFSPDSGTLAAGTGLFYANGSQGSLILWNLTTPQPRGSSHSVSAKGAVWNVAFNRKGTTLACEFHDNSSLNPKDSGVVLWDVASRGLLTEIPLTLPTWITKSMAYDPDRETLGVGVAHRDSKSYGVKLWNTDIKSCRNDASQVANRNLTFEEWTRYFLDVPYRRTFRSQSWPIDLKGSEREEAEAFEKEHPER